MHLGQYPTPVERIEALSSKHCSLWVKRDDLSNALYGGNKVRKLEAILQHARLRGAKRLVTFGAVGSHHVLATTIHGRQAGFEVAAVLTAQPRSEHVLGNLRAGLGLGLQAHPAASVLQVPVVLAKLLRRGDYLIAPGGSNLLGAQGYALAVAELAEQVARNELAMPEAIVVALGSGGTAAGLLEGVLEQGLRTRIIGVRVVDPPLVTRFSTLALAKALARKRGASASLSALREAFELDDSQRGRGYGYETAAGLQALALGAQAGLQLETTYTAKAFAAALSLVGSGRFGSVLYWHTLSSAPLGSLIAQGPRLDELPASLQALLL